MRKVVSFGIPCYNSANDMDHCIRSILEGAGHATDIEIIIVDDGSTDETASKADAWAARAPGLIRALHQPNGGHGIAVLAGLREATGIYYKVVDSDDWLDARALASMLSVLRGFLDRAERVDLFISNYVYEKVHEDKHVAINYRSALPVGRVFGWDAIGRFRPDQNLLMHSLCYRVDVLRKAALPLPAHTFYVDNIYAYVPLPHCDTIYYADIDLYRYFIGREGQSVNESVMIRRLDQQLRVTRIMMEAYRLYEDVAAPRLRSYMMGYFTMMMAICSVFTKLSDDATARVALACLWSDLKRRDARMYRRARYGVLGVSTNLPTSLGERITIGLYRAARRIFNFN
ncbi:glycosyl transferase family 2 [Coriobacterium glomerans PW2]|uniref:Glycosyl transferase family 2 n=1 Tax=Coriobacterium glomerans (strain ATCC 49209 / DSM 20642 / JCM 10262 / PW2) TaxID=700015 RepID=F2NBP9_CORGP|nr:glycosyltransferase [Coriobacterium glomerans]AEB06858.1 glycosyl transferase family 2 [Coriobacterium glomerans PW2]